MPERNERGQFISQTKTIDTEEKMKKELYLENLKKFMDELNEMEKQMKKRRNRDRWIWSIILSVYLGWIIGLIISQ